MNNCTLFCLVAALVITLETQAQTTKAFFCTEPGTTFRYERYSGSGEEHWWTQTTKVNTVTPQEDGSLRVDFTTTVKAYDVKSPLKEPVSSYAQVREDGTVEVNMAEAATIVAKQSYSAFNFKSSGGISALPAKLNVGEPLEEIHARVSWAMFAFTMDFTERSVLRQETITVPAGTFDCMVVRERKRERAPFLKRERITDTWYAQGYGLIRHDSYFTDGTQECSEQLCAIEN